jgi:ribosomal protein S18 acetylase RimI-like enzyme
MGLDGRPLVPGDAGEWVALLDAIEDADGSDDYSSEQDLRESFGSPNHDYPRGSVAIYDGRTMVGYGVLTFRDIADSAHTISASWLTRGSEPLGMLMSRESQAYQQRTGRRDLRIALVGTRAAGRKRGIATALLVTAMSAARAAGYDQASLGVDADSLTGAVRLYERAGFAVDHTWTAYRKQLTSS